ncbi:MAG: hypothetical protein D6782_09140 [Alphaproteobacteria bacterium]|nr:MAG: hypothetical protein D6782_09140 [Alphaproteobacteria bacterium]
MSQTGDSIPYDELVQGALKGVVRRVLADVAARGLPGAHHFYIAFKTKAPGVAIPPRLAEKYPDEMTIVLQHRFWNLQVDDDAFAVDLSFNQRRERLHIPFAALIGFVDPSVRFALQFQEQEAEAALPTARSLVPEMADAAEDSPASPSPAAKDDAAGNATGNAKAGDGNVVALDTFRKRPS